MRYDRHAFFLHEPDRAPAEALRVTFDHDVAKSIEGGGGQHR